MPLQGVHLLDRRPYPLNPTACQEPPKPRWEGLLWRRPHAVELHTRQPVSWPPRILELDWKLKLVACGRLGSQMC